ncbi:MAG: transposase [Opitutaceae bacterium]
MMAGEGTRPTYEGFGSVGGVPSPRCILSCALAACYTICANTNLLFHACTAARRPLLGNIHAFDCLSEIWKKSAALNGWFVGRFILMPDHVHFFASPSSGAKNRSDWTKLWKSVSARQLAKEFNVNPPFWQVDTFDHILRSAESYSEKWNYVQANPVRRGLVGRAENWRWQGELHSLAF